jgi:hypothetical protein
LPAVLTFWANIKFYQDLGYFDVVASYKPLLHTWSLAVEEQFYLLFPMLLIWIGSRRQRLRVTVMVLLGLASFSAMQSASSDAAFYLLPFRVWELLAGAVIAIMPRLGEFRAAQAPSYSTLRGAVCLIALLSIFGFGVVADKSVDWPGLATLGPVFATVAILAFASPDTWTYRVLATPLLRNIGLWSYSVYLWHFPVFSFSRYRYVGDLGTGLKLTLTMLSLLLGWLSWRFIESPFRDASRVSTRSLVRASVASCGVLVLLGFGASATASGTSSMVSTSNSGSVVLIGDSHADHLVSGLLPHFGDELSVLVSPGCVPLWGVDRFDFRFEKGACARFAEESITTAIDSPEARVVVLASMGPVYLTGETFRGFDPARVQDDGLVLVDKPEILDRWKVFEAGLRETLHRLQRAGKYIIVVIDNPELGIEPQHCETKEPESCRIPRTEFDARASRYHLLIRDVAAKSPVTAVFDPTNLFCDDVWCYGVKGDSRLYSDVDHLNEAGSRLVGEQLKSVIEQSIEAVK